MKLNKNNAQLINKKVFTLHDDILVSLYFYRDSKKLLLNCLKSCDANRSYTICFFEVVGLQMSSCDFWGASECILDFEYIDTSPILIPILLDKWAKTPVLASTPTYSDVIEVLLTMSSGDTFRIACKSIEFKM